MERKQLPSEVCFAAGVSFLALALLMNNPAMLVIGIVFVAAAFAATYWEEY